MRTNHARFIKRPLMCYYGSKFKFAEWVCGVLERIPHDVYVSPFGGSGGDLLGRTFPATVEAWNDIDGTLCNLFYVLREPDLLAQFLQRLECTEYSQVNVREAVDLLERYDRGEESDPVLLAWATYYRAWSSFAGTMHRSNMFGYVKNLIGGNNPPKQFRGAIETLPQIAGRLREVQVFNEDFETFVKRFDQGKDTLIYNDPPYPMESRSGGSGYLNEATDDLLTRLRGWALQAPCAVAISTYPCDWAQSFVEAGWSCYDKEVKAHSAMGRHGGAAGERTELILVNPVGQQKMDDDFTTL